MLSESKFLFKEDIYISSLKKLHELKRNGLNCCKVVYTVIAKHNTYYKMKHMSLCKVQYTDPMERYHHLTVLWCLRI